MSCFVDTITHRSYEDVIHENKGICCPHKGNNGFHGTCKIHIEGDSKLVTDSLIASVNIPWTFHDILVSLLYF